MSRVPYVCCTKQFEDHYTGQLGSGLPFYRGQLFYQKGYGIGGFFKRLFRSALPLIWKGAKTIGKEALLTGTRIASDVMEGEKLKTAVKQRSKEAGKLLAEKAIKKTESMLGKGKYKRKRKIHQRISSSKTRKLRRRDIFDS